MRNESVGARTQDLRLKRPLLYQLSYTPEKREFNSIPHEYELSTGLLKKRFVRTA